MPARLFSPPYPKKQEKDIEETKSKIEHYKNEKKGPEDWGGGDKFVVGSERNETNKDECNGCMNGLSYYGVSE